MKQNVGGIDKVVRIVAGIALIAWGLMTSNWLGAIGIIPIVTALISWCPAYSVIGFSSKGSGDA